jgi:hypothetical protein
VKPRTQDVIRKLESDRILSDLCLLTVQLFIKLGKLNEARNAIVEAEHAVWTNNPMVRCVLGQFLLASKKDAEYDQTAFNKALEIDPCHVTSRLELSKSYLIQDNC